MRNFFETGFCCDALMRLAEDYFGKNGRAWRDEIADLRTTEHAMFGMRALSWGI